MKQSNTGARGLCSVLAFAAACTGTAHAQSASVAGADSGSALEEIVVTARKREESLMSVPVSVSAISGAMLERSGAKDLVSIAQQTPGLTIVQSGSGSGASITMRGIGSSVLDPGIEQSVTTNIDGVQISRGRLIVLGMFDLQQVEVLKGPQALFFGKNSPAGVISLTSKGPTDRISGYVTAGYEFEARQRYAEGAVGGPLSDTLGARIAVRASKMDGWAINRAQAIPAPYAPTIILPGAASRRIPAGRDLLGRLTLTWKPTDSFDATAKLFVAHHRDNEPGAATQVICPAGAVPLSFGLPDPTGDCNFNKYVSTTATPAIIAAGFPHGKSTNRQTVNAKFASLNMNYTTDTLKLTSVTGYYTLKSDGFQGATGDVTSNSRIFFELGENTKNFTQEFRLSSDFESPFNFTVGAFYEKGSRSGYNDAMIAFLGVAAGTNKYHTFERYVTNHNETLSGFGQLRWNIVENVELAGGARWTHEKRTGMLVNNFVHPLLIGNFRPQGVPLNAKFSDDDVSPEVTLSWHPTRNSTLYAAYKTGYKSGGISSTAVLSPLFNADNIKFAPETAEGGEIGYKAELLDRRLRVETTAFLYNYDGLQLTSYNAATITYIIRNAAKARTKGIDFSASFRASQPLTLHGAFGYAKARYVDFRGAPCWTGQLAIEGCVAGTQDLSGQPLTRAPKWTANVGANYDIPLNDSFKLSVGVTGRYSSGYFAQENQQPLSYQKGYWLLDANARLYSDGGGWKLSLIGRNLTNKYYFNQTVDKSGGGRDQITATTPRTREIAVQASYRF